MRVGFITPMKRPDHPVPSGDRTFARLIVEALGRAGHEAVPLGNLTTWRAVPDGFDALEGEARREVERLKGELAAKPVDALLTYHNYHKAPDLIGPPLARRFDVPYAIIEASRAPRRANGAWARQFARADEALAEADVVAAISRHDEVEVAAHVGERFVRFAPFIDAARFEGRRIAEPGARLVSVAMMRQGRKADSLRLLAEAFALVRQTMPEASLAIVGDGPARASLEPLFPGGTFVGALDRGALARCFAEADLFVWPAIDEPFGFVFLEAQAAGLPVVGGDYRGVADAMEDGVTGLLAPPGEARPFADAILTILADRERMMAMGSAALSFAGQNDLDAGAARLDGLLARAHAHRATARRRAAAVSL